MIGSHAVSSSSRRGHALRVRPRLRRASADRAFRLGVELVGQPDPVAVRLPVVGEDDQVEAVFFAFDADFVNGADQSWLVPPQA